MDLLYARYSNPLNLLSIYANQGRLGAFVHGFLKEESARRSEEAEKTKEMKLWIAYIHSFSKESYGEWKEQIERQSGGKNTPVKGSDQTLDDAGIQSIMNDLFPE